MRAAPRCDQGIAFEESMPIRGQAKSSGHRSLSLLALHSRIGPMNSRVTTGAAVTLSICFQRQGLHLGPLSL